MVREHASQDNKHPGPKSYAARKEHQHIDPSKNACSDDSADNVDPPHSAANPGLSGVSASIRGEASHPDLEDFSIKLPCLGSLDPSLPRNIVQTEESPTLNYNHTFSAPTTQSTRLARYSPKVQCASEGIHLQHSELSGGKQKRWQHKPETLVSPSSTQLYEEEQPQYFVFYQGQYYPMDKTSTSVPAAPVLAYQKGSSTSQSEPLINRIKNEWQRNPHTSHRSGVVYNDRDAPNISAIFRRFFRRRSCLYILVAVIALFLFIRSLVVPRREIARLQNSIRDRLSEERGFFGVNQRVGFANMVQVHSLERWKVPGSGVRKDGTETSDPTNRRLIIVGDIHGCVDELHELLDKVNFDFKTDHLVAAGDMVTSGPDSGAVVSFLMDQHASCVRGNHEDRILLAHRDINSPSHRKIGADGNVESIKQGAASDLSLAKDLTETQIKYLASCPVILDLGTIPTMGSVSVVHAGLVPAVSLAKQDPGSVMTMRSIDLRSHVPSKNPAPAYPKKKDTDKWGRSLLVPWTDLWEAYQGMVGEKEKSSVVFGHDSKRGVRIGKWTYGMDGGCVKGGELAALVISEMGQNLQREVFRIPCKDHRVKEKTGGEDLGGG